MQPKRPKFVLKVVDIRTSPGYDENLSVIIIASYSIFFPVVNSDLFLANIQLNNKK